MSATSYEQFCIRKSIQHQPHGILKIGNIHPTLFDWQRRVVEFALRTGRAALFLDTGLGKTICQIEWARHIPGEVLILAPPAVAPQTVREAREKLSMDINHSRDGSVVGKVTITNYERLHLFDTSRFSGVVLDESSILKSFAGKTKNLLCSTFQATPFRLACTATPAPNDYTELGNHCDFLGVMPQSQMLARWFINDTADTGTWRLKGHAKRDFWSWVGTWAACIEKPSDAGGDDAPFALPELTTRMHSVCADLRPSIEQGTLFGAGELSASSMYADKRATLTKRCELAAKLASTDDYAIVWCETNDESRALASMIEDCVEVVGSDDPDEKEEKLDAFSRGEIRVIVTKPSIAGFGLNWQHCNHVIFASLNYSYESFYQAVRRTWRFGQKRPVTVDCVIADTENNIWTTIKQKLNAHSQMKQEMRLATFRHRESERHARPSYKLTELPSWLAAPTHTAPHLERDGAHITPTASNLHSRCRMSP